VAETTNEPQVDKLRHVLLGQPLWPTVRRILRARITAGLIFILPIWITYLLVRFVFELMRDMSYWVVVYYLEHTERGRHFVATWSPSAKPGEVSVSALPTELQWGIGILCVLLTIAFLYVVGVFTANFVGRRLVRGFENMLNRVPFVKTIYRATKQILDSFTGESARGLQRVVLVPFPTEDVRSVGFITGLAKDTNTGEELCTVFLATTPNPTTGYVFVMKRGDLIELDWSIQDAVAMVMSGGVVVPDKIPLASPCTLPGVPAVTAKP
jgi:uncharacterized membrane protein